MPEDIESFVEAWKGKQLGTSAGSGGDIESFVESWKAKQLGQPAAPAAPARRNAFGLTEEEMRARQSPPVPPPDRSILGEARTALERASLAGPKMALDAIDMGLSVAERATQPIPAVGTLVGATKTLYQQSPYNAGARTYLDLATPERSQEEGITVRGTVGDVIEGVPQFAGQVGLGVLGGAVAGPPGAIAGYSLAGAAPVALQTYSEAKRYWLTKNPNDIRGAEDKALLEAAGASGITGLTEVIPGASILGKIPGGGKVLDYVTKGVVKKVLTGGALEVTQEYLENLLQDGLKVVMSGDAERFGPGLTDAERLRGPIAAGFLGGGAAAGVAAGEVASNREQMAADIAATNQERQRRSEARMFRQVGRGITEEMQTTPVQASKNDRPSPKVPEGTPGEQAMQMALESGNPNLLEEARALLVAERRLERRRAARPQTPEPEAAPTPPATAPTPPKEAKQPWKGEAPAVLSREEAKAKGWDQSQFQDALGTFDTMYRMAAEANADPNDTNTYAVVKAARGQFGIVSRARTKAEASRARALAKPKAAPAATPTPASSNTAGVPAQPPAPFAPSQETGQPASPSSATPAGPASEVAPTRPGTAAAPVPVSGSSQDDIQTVRAAFDLTEQDDDAAVLEKYQRRSDYRAEEAGQSKVKVSLASPTEPETKRAVEAGKRRGVNITVVRSSGTPYLQGMASNGRVVVDLSAEMPLAPLVAHEALHPLQDADEKGDTAARAVRQKIASVFSNRQLEAAANQYESQLAGSNKRDFQNNQRRRRREAEAVALDTMIAGPKGDNSPLQVALRDRIIRQPGFLNRIKVMVGNAMNRLGMFKGDQRSKMIAALDAWEVYAKNSQATGTSEASESVAAVNEIDPTEAALKGYGAWIGPEGKVYSVGYQQHGGVARALSERYDYSESKDDMLSSEDRYRIPAMDKGLVRVVRAGKSLRFQVEKFTPANRRVVMQMAEAQMAAGGEFLVDHVPSRESVGGGKWNTWAEAKTRLAALGKESEASESVGKPGPIDSTTMRMNDMGVINAPQLKTIGAIGKYFDEQYLKQNGRVGSPFNPKDYAKARAQMAKEIRFQNAMPESGKDWYNKDIKKAYEITKDVMPELRGTTREARSNRIFMATIAAIYSPGTVARLNWNQGLKAMREFLDTGRFARVDPNTGDNFSGKNGRTRNIHMSFTEYLIGKYGDHGAASWILGSHTKDEIQAEIDESALWSAGTKFKQTEDMQVMDDGTIPGSYVFGPKEGAFIRNIAGLPDVTVDLWASRTFNRLFGRMTEGAPEGKTKDSPREGERAIVKKLIRDVAEDTGELEQNVQAIAWFYEQQLFSDLGTATKSTKFSQGAQDYVNELPANLALRERRRNANQRMGDQPQAKVKRKQPKPQGLFGSESVRARRDANPAVREVAEGYMKSVGRPYDSGAGEFVPWDEERAKRIADAYDAMDSGFDKPGVRESYEQLADETLEQYDYMVGQGYTAVPWGGPAGSQPYANSQEMVDDVRDNKRIYYFKTIQEGVDSFGGTAGSGDHPFLKSAGRPAVDSAGNTYDQTYNDLFRAVHDFFGHAKEGYQFGPRGEENAWRAHSRMFTPMARKAMTSETRGQNSWVNAGKHLRKPDGSLRQKGDEGYVAPQDRPFADQKYGLLPDWAIELDGPTSASESVAYPWANGRNILVQKAADDVSYLSVGHGPGPATLWRSFDGRTIDAKDVPVGWQQTHYIFPGFAEGRSWTGRYDPESKFISIAPGSNRMSFDRLIESLSRKFPDATGILYDRNVPLPGDGDESIRNIKPEQWANQLVSSAFGRGVKDPTLAVVRSVAARLPSGKAAPYIDAMRGALGRVGQEFMPDRYLLPEWVAARKQAQIESRFGKAIAASYGTLLHYGGTSKMLGFEIDRKWIGDPANRRLLNDVLLGDATINSLPAEYQPVARKIRRELDDLGQRAVNAGFITQETYDTHKGKYLPRLYLPRELEKRGLMGAVNRLRMNNDRRQPRKSDAFYIETSGGQLIDGPNGQFRFQSALDRDSYLDGLIQTQTVQEVNRSIRGSGQKITLADLSPIALGKLSQPLRQLIKNTKSEVAARYVKGDPLDDATLDRMGLIREASYPVAAAMLQLHHDLALLKFYAQMAKNPDVASDIETSLFSEQVPNSPKFGDLAGKWVPSEIHRDLSNMTHAPGLALEFYRTTLAMWKYGKTVLNPATWGRNILGNMQFADFAGVGPHDPRNWGHYGEAYAILAGKRGPDAIQRLYKLGILGTEFQAAELSGILNEIGVPLNAERSPVGWAWQFAGKLNRNLSAGYNAIDVIFKVASFVQQVDNGVTPRDAADHVRKWFPDYSAVPNTGTVRGLKDMIFPFFSFQYEAVRINATAIREKPLTFAKWASVPALITQLSIAALGLGGDDEEEIKKELRGGGVFAMLLPFRDSQGRLIQWDLSNVVPVAGLTGMRTEASPLEDKSMVESIFGGLITSNPFMNLAVALGMNEDPFTRRPITATGMTGGERAAAVANQVRRAAQPGFINAIETNVRAGQVQKSTLDKRDRTTTALRTLVGIDVRSADPLIRRMVDQYIEDAGLPLGSEYGGDTTPRQRAGREMYQALLDNDREAFQSAIQSLNDLGVPMRTVAEIKATIQSRHPLARLRKEHRETFLRGLTKEQRRVVASALAEYEKLLPRALRLR